MSGDDIEKLLLALLALGTASIPLIRSRGSRRALLRLDIELWEKLPDSKLRAQLLTHIETSIAGLMHDETVKRRDPNGIILGVLLMGIAAAVGAIAFANGGWWYALLVPAVIVFLFGAVGFSEDVIPRERDEKGRTIRAANRSPKQPTNAAVDPSTNPD